MPPFLQCQPGFLWQSKIELPGVLEVVQFPPESILSTSVVFGLLTDGFLVLERWCRILGQSEVNRPPVE